jgi:hypothetical protein
MKTPHRYQRHQPFADAGTIVQENNRQWTILFSMNIFPGMVGCADERTSTPQTKIDGAGWS